MDRQRLLGDRSRVFESVLEDGLEGIEHQERYVLFKSSPIILLSKVFFTNWSGQKTKLYKQFQFICHIYH